jgi:fructokinase
MNKSPRLASRPERHLYAGVELGGTKCICTLGTAPDDIRAQVRIRTGEPESTLSQIGAVLDAWWRAHSDIQALGLASFGPLDLRPESATFGHITATTKLGWRGTDIVGRLGRRRNVPLGFNTDVNGAALAEQRWGAARGYTNFAYVTVGTGVGVGLIVDGHPVFGCNHSEFGHARIARRPGDSWPGACQFHGDCVEGLASGRAISARTGVPAVEVPAESPVWDLVAHALAQMLHNIVLATAPRRILVGGGVMQAHPELFTRMRQQLDESLNGYLDLEELTGGIDGYIVPPGLGPLAGPLGALALAADAWLTHKAAATSVTSR